MFDRAYLAGRLAAEEGLVSRSHGGCGCPHIDSVTPCRGTAARCCPGIHVQRRQLSGESAGISNSHTRPSCSTIRTVGRRS